MGDLAQRRKLLTAGLAAPLRHVGILIPGKHAARTIEVFDLAKKFLQKTQLFAHRSPNDHASCWHQANSPSSGSPLKAASTSRAMSSAARARASTVCAPICGVAIT